MSNEREQFSVKNSVEFSFKFSACFTFENVRQWMFLCEFREHQPFPNLILSPLRWRRWRERNLMEMGHVSDCRTPTDVGKAEIVSPSHTRGWRSWCLCKQLLGLHHRHSPLLLLDGHQAKLPEAGIDHDHILSSWSMAANKTALLHPVLLMLINSTDNSDFTEIFGSRSRLIKKNFIHCQYFQIWEIFLRHLLWEWSVNSHHIKSEKVKCLVVWWGVSRRTMAWFTSLISKLVFSPQSKLIKEFYFSMDKWFNCRGSHRHFHDSFA